MKIGESICDYCFHNNVCDFRENVYGNWRGHDICPHPQEDMFLGWVRTKDELPPDREEVVMMDEDDNPFVGIYFSVNKSVVDNSTNRKTNMPTWWFKGLAWF